MSKLWGVVPFRVLADQSKWIISKSHTNTLVSSIFFFGHSPPIFCHTCFFFHPSLSPSARKLRELQQNVIQREHIRRLRGPAGGGQQKTGGGGRVEVPPGARVGLVKPGEKLGCVMHLLYLCRYGKMMFFFVDFLG